MGMRNRYLVERRERYKGYMYKVVLYERGYRCGYVHIPLEHPMIALSQSPENASWLPYDYTKFDIECHWGLSYMNEGFPSRGVWIGFDCNHLHDGHDVEAVMRVWPDASLEDFEPGLPKGTDYVEADCKSIIDQLHKKYPGEIKANKDRYAQWYPEETE